MRKINDHELIQMSESGTSQQAIAIHFNVSPAAVCKRLKRLRLPDSMSALTQKEQKFAVAILEGKSQTAAAAQAFDCGTLDSAKSFGHNLMKRDDIKLAIQDIMREEGLTRRYRIKRLRHHVDAQDPNISLKGLDQCWRLDGSYSPEKHLVAHQVQSIDALSSDAKEIIKEAIRAYHQRIMPRLTELEIAQDLDSTD